jgi:glycosyltransferase involved in cell wall biosynthesis
MHPTQIKLNKIMNEEKVQIIINNNKYRSVFWGDRFYDTGVPINVSISDALRLSHLFNVKCSFPYKEYNSNWWKNNKTFGMRADADSLSGYGNCTVNLIKYSEKSGCDVRWIGRGINVPEFAYLPKKPVPLDIAMVWHDQPRNTWLESPFQKNIAITPFETTLIPSSWVPKLNFMDAVFVPCKQNIEMMRNSGVRVPIELIHWGIDETKWYPIERNNNVFTFGTVGALSERKGFSILIQAFEKAFPSSVKDVRLLLKTSFNGMPPIPVKDDRIITHFMSVSNDILIDVAIRQIDCGVFPTRGEGFGLVPLELMATGIPVIVTGWSGPLEYMNEEIGWILDYKMVPADIFSNEIYKEYCGDWAEPSIDDLVDKMRYAYNHQDEVKEKGKKAEEYVKQNWLWKDKIKMFIDALDKHL